MSFVLLFTGLHINYSVLESFVKRQSYYLSSEEGNIKFKLKLTFNNYIEILKSNGASKHLI